MWPITFVTILPRLIDLWRLIDRFCDYVIVGMPG